MVSIIKKMKNTEDGVAAVEFALVLPILLILLFGIIEFSIIFYNKAMITNASREGARAGIVYNGQLSKQQKEQEITTVVNEYLGNNLINFDEESSPPIIDIDGAGGDPGTTLTVKVIYDYNYLILPNFVKKLDWMQELYAVTRMRNE